MIWSFYSRLILLFIGMSMGLYGQGQPKLEVTERAGVKDGFMYRDLYLGNSDINMKMPAPNGWHLEDYKGEAAALLSRYYSEDNKDYLSILLYGKGGLIIDFSKEELGKYVELKKKEFIGRKINFLNEEKGFEVKDTFFILGKPYRLVEFQVGEGDLARYYRDYIVFIDNEKCGLVVFRHESKFLAGGGNIEYSLRFSELINKE